jgi:hypothetical protein
MCSFGSEVSYSFFQHNQLIILHLHSPFFLLDFRYGLPTITGVPSGFAPLLELWGKGKNRFPLLVSMNHPLSWVVTLPNNNVNGEDGTIQAGEYAKGDTATLFVYQEEGHINVRRIFFLFKKGDTESSHFSLVRLQKTNHSQILSLLFAIL